jgi:predicted CXXCH cytochrome family protein
MMMKKRIWWTVLFVLVLITSGCGPQPAETPPQPKATEQKEVISEEPASSAAMTEPEPVEVRGIDPEAQPPVAAGQDRPASETRPDAGAPAAIVIYEVPFGQVVFNHEVHAVSLDCASCHGAEPQAKLVLGKEKAHELCIGCHKEMAAGPTQCSGCHKRN